MKRAQLTNVVRVKLIDTNKRRQCRGSETPLGKLSNDRELAGVNVIRNARIKLIRKIGE